MTLRMDTIMNLAEYLQAEVEKTSYRRVSAKTKLSKSAIEKIVKEQNEGLPELETLIAIAEAYDLPLSEVEEMAGVQVSPPKTPEEVSLRLGQIVTQVPILDQLVTDLRDLYVQDPSFVQGMIAGLEASIAHWKSQKRTDEEADRQGDQ